MRINDIIQSKGSTVITARADDTVAHLAGLLAERGIGAAVIVDDVGQPIGIAGERDVVRAVHEYGATALTMPVSAIAASALHTCGLDDEIAEVASAMTVLRTRHVPVLVNGELAAIVSIGDIVKSRIDQLQQEQEHLVNYLHGTAETP